MDDVELLDLAAKAYASQDIKKLNFGAWFNGARGAYWNPLADDGDALRLAVKLHIDLELNNGSTTAIWIDMDRSETHTVVEACDEEFQGWRAKEGATRRAIVCAAAEIGRAKINDLSPGDAK